MRADRPPPAPFSTSSTVLRPYVASSYLPPFLHVTTPVASLQTFIPPDLQAQLREAAMAHVKLKVTTPGKFGNDPELRC